MMMVMVMMIMILIDRGCGVVDISDVNTMHIHDLILMCKLENLFTTKRRVDEVFKLIGSCIFPSPAPAAVFLRPFDVAGSP